MLQTVQAGDPQVNEFSLPSDTQLRNTYSVNRASRTIRVFISVFASFLGVVIVLLVLNIFIPPVLRMHVYWVLCSRHYKHLALASPRTSGQLPHAEWEGDGWGGAPVGDWMGYVVFDPSDSLPQAGTTEPARKIKGVPCDAVAVRRLEKNWYSVVTAMNQFWDSNHPNC
jgi:hypothetical protein